MFLKNDIIQYSAAPLHAIRILWIDENAGLAYIFALGQAKALPRPVPLQQLALDLQTRRARLLLNDPWRAVVTHDPPEHHRLIQAKAWAAVRALHQHLPLLFDRSWRSAAVAEHARTHAMSPANVMRNLRRYWERGQTPDALLPDYARSGAPGKARVPNAGVKRGRPSKAPSASPNADAGLRAIFRAAAARYAAQHPEFSRRAAYRQMLAEDFAGCAPHDIPSYGQFIYWLGRDRIADAVHDAPR